MRDFCTKYVTALLEYLTALLEYLDLLNYACTVSVYFPNDLSTSLQATYAFLHQLFLQINRLFRNIPIFFQCLLFQKLFQHDS